MISQKKKVIFIKNRIIISGKKSDKIAIFLPYISTILLK